jgi:hypothetical protein
LLIYALKSKAERDRPPIPTAAAASAGHLGLMAGVLIALALTYL